MLKLSSIGIILLEIGLWEPALLMTQNRFEDGSHPLTVQASFQKQAKRKLKLKMGEKYRDVVLKRLSGNFGVYDNTKDELKLQQAFRNQVVDVLERTIDDL